MSTPGMWRPRPARRGIDDGGGDDLALIDNLDVGQVRDAGGGGDSILMTADPNHDLQIRTQGRDNAGGNGTPKLKPKVPVLDGGAGADLARLGLYGYDEGAGTDRALVTPRSPGRDAAGGHDRAQPAPRFTVRDMAGAGDEGTGWFSSHAATLTHWTTAGTYNYAIPVWSRYLDLTGLGGGGAGGSGGWFLNGSGGSVGTWGSTTLERGVHIPWTLVTISITVGANGTGSSGNNGGSGGATTITYNGTTLTCPGGSGGTSQNGGTQNGSSAGALSYGGQSYPGGTGGTGNAGAASGNGSGGAGGSGSFGSTKAGGAGSPGRASIRARQ